MELLLDNKAIFFKLTAIFGVHTPQILIVR